MPTSRGLLCVALGTLLALVATAAAQTRTASSGSTADSLAKRSFGLADEENFSQAELLLNSLAESHPRSPERAAAVLYAAERAYAAGEGSRAAAWLTPLATTAPPNLRTAVAAALAWTKVNPRDFKVPTARLLEMAEQHDASSLAPIALQVRGEKLASAQRPDEAIFVYHMLLAKFPQSRIAPAALLAVARLHHELRQQREAWQYLERLVAEHPQAAQIDAGLYLGVLVAQEMKNEAAAEQWLEKLVAEHEQSLYWPDAAYRLAERQVASGEHAAAAKLVARIVGSQKSEVRGQKSEIGGQTELGQRARFLLVRIAVAESDWAAVEKCSQELIVAKAAEPIKTLAEFWLAEAAYRRGERDLAFTRFLDLSLAIEERQEDWLGVVPLRLAQIEAQRQKWANALEWTDLLAQELPNYSRMHEVNYVRGRSLTALARFSEARAALARVTTSNAAKTETAAMSQWLIGETYFQQRQYENAIAAYQPTLVGDFPQWRAAGLLQTAKCCEQLGRWSDAADGYEQLLSDHGDTRYAVEAQTRLAMTQERAKLAAQTSTDTTKR